MGTDGLSKCFSNLAIALNALCLKLQKTCDYIEYYQYYK